MTNKIKEIKRELLRRSYYDFFLEFWAEVSSEKLIDNWHIKYLCNELELACTRVMNREKSKGDIIINVPPGSSKSSIVTILLPAWCWVNDQTLQFITSSYSNSLSIKHASDTRKVMESERFVDLFGDVIQFSKSEDNKQFYRLTKGGYRLTTSTKSSVIGNHGHIIIIDDPIDPLTVKSEAFTEQVDNHINQTLSQRKVNRDFTLTIMVMQRLSQDDPTGDWLRKAANGEKDVIHYCLPATDEYPILPKEAANFYVDGLFDPIRLNRKAISDTINSMGTINATGQLWQQPSARGGNKIKEDWFLFLDSDNEPDILDLWIDGAYTTNNNNDPTGIMICGMKDNKLHIVHASSVRLELPDLIREITRISSEWLSIRSKIYVEPKASGLSIIQTINSMTNGAAKKIEGNLVKDGKEARIQASAIRLEAGKVVLQKGNWNKEFIAQHTIYPNSKHDEYVDLLGYACEKYFSARKKAGMRYVN